MKEEERERTAEIIATCCLTTDLGMGFPFEHGFHGTLMAMELADLLGVDSETKAHTYCCCLLMYTGCTMDSHIATRIFEGKRTESVTPVQFGSRMEMFGGVVRAPPPPDIPSVRRLYEVARRLPKAARFESDHFTALCDVAEMLAARFGCPPPSTVSSKVSPNGGMARACWSGPKVTRCPSPYVSAMWRGTPPISSSSPVMTMPLK